MSERIVISAIICTHNRVRYLTPCIESLLSQSLDRNLYEILVIDNGSTDSTRQVVSKYESEGIIRYIYEPILGLSQARNTGWQQARGEYVGYIDDDATADYLWLEKAVESFEQNPKPDWVGGAVTLVWEKEPPSWLTQSYYSALGWVDWGEKPRYLESDKEWLVGCNSLFRRNTLELIGGFDVRLGRKENVLLSGEEVQVHHRLKSKGGKFYYHPLVRVNHHVSEERVTEEYFYKRYYWGGITDHLMSRTLKGIPSQIVTEDGIENSRLKRLLTNFLCSFGILAAEDKAIQSRIYMSYVAGHIVALLRYGWKNVGSV